MSFSHNSLEEEIKARAISLGFSIVGITNSGPLDNYQAFQDWIANGNHAGMAWLASHYHQHTRQSPARLDPWVRSVIVLGLNYPFHPTELSGNSQYGLVSGYATGEDYHSRIPRMVEPLLEFLRSELGGNCKCKVYSDSSPILERELAVRAGLGWVGRNSCLINPGIGSNLLLAEVFLDRELTPDSPFLADRCGTCQKCIQACPTSCILPNRTIDARRCIAYHNIENRGDIPVEFMEKQSNWFFGCDICQMVCPWNHPSETSFSPKKFSIEEMRKLLGLSPLEIAVQFKTSAVQRVKPPELIRNLLIVLINQNAITMDEIKSVIEANSDNNFNSILDWVTEKQKDLPK